MTMLLLSLLIAMVVDAGANSVGRFHQVNYILQSKLERLTTTIPPPTPPPPPIAVYLKGRVADQVIEALEVNGGGATITASSDLDSNPDPDSDSDPDSDPDLGPPELFRTAPLMPRGVRLHEMSAFVILVVCLVLTVFLVLSVGFYCFVHCWRHHKEILSASANRRNFQRSRTPRRSTFTSRLSFFRRTPSTTARSVRGSLTEDGTGQMNGKLPQIRISFSNTDQIVPENCRSRLSTASVLPPWMEHRSSICNTPQSPNSPLFFTFNGAKEPLLGPCSQSQSQQPSFWQRIAGRSSTSSQDQNDTFFKLNMENGFCDDRDREIDDRSVLHYELGSYEKTKTSCFRGTLTFSLRYDFIHRVLMLHVLRANHLSGQDKSSLPHPYVKMYLLPERRNHCKTRMIKKSADPEFNEMFSFDVAYNNLANRMLQFTVYDFDRFTRHGLIGNVIMRDLFDKSELLQWTEYTMQVVGSQEKNDFGDLLLYLAYSIPHRKLYITVAKAYNLRPMDITGASDPYVRCEQIYQRRRIKLRKTSIKRANLNPVYHECLEFDLPPSQIDETNILIQVMDWDRIGSDDLLGCCVLGKESPTKEGRQQWEQVFSVVKATFNLLTPEDAAGPDSILRHRAEDNMPHAVGQWHSILGDVPDGFRNIPKATKKQVQQHQTCARA